MWQLPWKPPKNNIQQNGLKIASIASWSHHFNFSMTFTMTITTGPPSPINRIQPGDSQSQWGDTSHDDLWTKFQTASWDGQNIDQFVAFLLCCELQSFWAGWLDFVWWKQQKTKVSSQKGWMRQIRWGIGCLESPAAGGICHFQKFQSYDDMSHPGLHTRSNTSETPFQSTPNLTLCFLAN